MDSSIASPGFWPSCSKSSILDHRWDQHLCNTKSTTIPTPKRSEAWKTLQLQLMAQRLFAENLLQGIRAVDDLRGHRIPSPVLISRKGVIHRKQSSNCHAPTARVRKPALLWCRFVGGICSTPSEKCAHSSDLFRCSSTSPPNPQIDQASWQPAAALAGLHG